MAKRNADETRLASEEPPRVQQRQEALNARREALNAQREPPLFHDCRLGGLIDDSWTVVRLLEAALPTEGGSKREIPGLDGELGPLPFPVSKKELKLVREAATEFIHDVKAFTDEGLLAFLTTELENDADCFIEEHIFLKDGLEDGNVVQAVARTFVRKHLGNSDQPDLMAKMRDQLRDQCLEQVADPHSKLGRKAHRLVHNLNDLCIDLQRKAMYFRQKEADAQMRIPDDPKVPLEEGE